VCTSSNSLETDGIVSQSVKLQFLLHREQYVTIIKTNWFNAFYLFVVAIVTSHSRLQWRILMSFMWNLWVLFIVCDLTQHGLCTDVFLFAENQYQFVAMCCLFAGWFSDMFRTDLIAHLQGNAIDSW
jgi:hypothetical protein